MAEERQDDRWKRDSKCSTRCQEIKRKVFLVILKSRILSPTISFLQKNVKKKLEKQVISHPPPPKLQSSGSNEQEYKTSQTDASLTDSLF